MLYEVITILIITGQVILTIALLAGKARKPVLPDLPGRILIEFEGVRLAQEIVIGLFQLVEPFAAQPLVQPGIEMLFVKASPSQIMGASRAGEPNDP